MENEYQNWAFVDDPTDRAEKQRAARDAEREEWRARHESTSSEGDAARATRIAAPAHAPRPASYPSQPERIGRVPSAGAVASVPQAPRTADARPATPVPASGQPVVGAGGQASTPGTRQPVKRSKPGAKQGGESGDEERLWREFQERRGEFEKWLRMEERRERLWPVDDEEARVYSCAGWHVCSPMFEPSEALENSKTRSWEAQVIYSKVQSLAFVRRTFKGCECEPLRVNDRRCAEEKLSKYRGRRGRLRGKQVFVPNASDLGEGDAS